MTEYVLWGSHPSYADGVPIKLTGGSLAECRRERRWRESDGGWTALAIRKAASTVVGHACANPACLHLAHMVLLSADHVCLDRECCAL